MQYKPLRPSEVIEKEIIELEKSMYRPLHYGTEDLEVGINSDEVDIQK
ncbi:MAG: hypothetical protein GX359_07550 [Clostridiales bacterium]|nr:hypothetical protein [Clostridiales bacterium]